MQEVECSFCSEVDIKGLGVRVVDGRVDVSIKNWVLQSNIDVLT